MKVIGNTVETKQNDNRDLYMLRYENPERSLLRLYSGLIMHTDDRDFAFNSDMTRIVGESDDEEEEQEDESEE